MKRRSFLQNLVLAGSAMALPVTQQAHAKPLPWRNWSGSQVCYPENRLAPTSVAELSQIIQATRGNIRAVGAGHSFSPLVPTNDTMITLSRLNGIVSVDQANTTATIWAGTRLGDIGEPLAAENQALQNMPDIDEQTLAGSLATATHGTGESLGCLSSFITSMQLVTSTGETLECSSTKNADVFQAAKVGLGSLGIVTQVTLQNQKPYRLKRETSWMSIEDILANTEQLASNNRNYEFYYIPFTGMGFIDVQNVTEEPVSVTEKIDQNDGANDLKTARDLLSWSSTLRELVLGTYIKTLPDEVTVAASWQNYASERNVRFNEMEYHLPRENLVPAFEEIRKLVETQFPRVFFPFEVRYVKQDDAWLSPFNGRETASIAVHRFFQEDHLPLFKAVEPIFRKYHGRPHWGKFNTMEAQDFAKHYEHWNDFKEVRRSLDPNGKFMNRYLKSLFTA
ncbi:FAD-binding protein [Bermanella marisrubri]|uniref:Oxidoreductase, FAD-binding protein n=1 Tax=Bermanella marisrubri TaxID=207949 RepID=Q1N1U0_9GAMM|nr:D-arabinono-1,4-lactone oxidase [Bermanella marisrubri]EAT12191.1 oxidoreductase, FAD-binding protein [Oceanobacter sp. RED65] [Bermanella marisrubri]QIZ83664.1 FAD-binding protein [Bermanella marisrubri]